MSRESIRERLRIDPDAEGVVLKYANDDIPALLALADAVADPEIQHRLRWWAENITWPNRAKAYIRAQEALALLEDLP